MPDNTLPTRHEPIGDLGSDISASAGLPPSLQILLNEGFYTRMKQLGMLMANAAGFTPKHLLGKGEACFAVINCALDWKLNPHFVARHTYQTPGGQIGFDGALTQAILEKSNRFVGSPKIEYRGDWSKLVGKFERKTGQRGGEYLSPTWTDKDAIGLGVIMRWQVRGEAEPRIWPGEDEPFWLTQCHPRNSTLWATDPKTQIAYLAIRRFASLAAPGIVGAAGFDEGSMANAADMARDITPPSPPTREQFSEVEIVDDVALEREETKTESAPVFPFITRDGEATEFNDPENAAQAMLEALRDTGGDRQAIAALWEDNEDLMDALDGAGRSDLADEIHEAARPPRRNPERAAIIDPAPKRFEETERRDVGEIKARPSVGGGSDAALTRSPPRAQPDAPVERVEAPQPREVAPIEMPLAFEREAQFAQHGKPASKESAGDKPAVRSLEPPLRNGKPDYRTWRIVLFDAAARRCQTVEDFATLIGDCHEHIEAHDRALPDQAAAFEAARKARMERLAG